MAIPNYPPIGSNLPAGELCLEFANTSDWHASGSPQERLRTYRDLVEWCRRAGVLNAARATGLLRNAQRRPASAAAALRHAIEVREVLYRIVVSLLSERQPRDADLTRLNRELQAAFRHLRVAPGSAGRSLDWDLQPGDLDGVLWPVVLSAADLLTSERRERIGQCADDRGCGWLFLDTTRNHSRRWCKMADCGNRAKARRHYARSHSSPEQNPEESIDERNI